MGVGSGGTERWGKVGAKLVWEAGSRGSVEGDVVGMPCCTAYLNQERYR